MRLTPVSSTPHLVLGAAKSGKSAHAEHLVTCLDPPYVYIATAQILDEEMAERVRSHRARRTHSWETIDAPLALIDTLESLRRFSKPVLVDCLTLWLTNLLLAPRNPDPLQAVSALCDLLPNIDYPLFLVSNEVGAGIVPDNSLARRFRDLAGIANQQIAKTCKSVTLVVAGLPVQLK